MIHMSIYLMIRRNAVIGELTFGSWGGGRGGEGERERERERERVRERRERYGDKRD